MRLVCGLKALPILRPGACCHGLVCWACDAWFLIILAPTKVPKFTDDTLECRRYCKKGQTWATQQTQTQVFCLCGYLLLPLQYVWSLLKRSLSTEDAPMADKAERTSLLGLSDEGCDGGQRPNQCNDNGCLVRSTQQIPTTAAIEASTSRHVLAGCWLMRLID